MQSTSPRSPTSGTFASGNRTERTLIMKSLKQIRRRGFSLLIAFTMCLSLLPASAFAAEEGTGEPDAETATGLSAEAAPAPSAEAIPEPSAEAAPSAVTVESKPGGGEESVDVIVQITNSDDNSEITTTATIEGGDTTDGGLKVEYQEIKHADGSGTSSYQVTGSGNTDSETTDSGNTYSENTYSASGGNETTVAQGPEEDISVDIITDGTTQDSAQGSSGSAGSETTGDLKQDDPANYDQTTVTTTDRTVDVSQAEVSVTTGDPTFVDENGDPIGPALDDGYLYYWDWIYTIDNEPYIRSQNNASSGSICYYIIDADGNPGSLSESEGTFQRSVRSDNGTPHDPSDDEIIRGLYCADKSTVVNEAFSYRKANLEDAVEDGYYSAEDAAHLRAILKYGWDWSDGKDKTDNLDAIKQMMRESGQFDRFNIDTLTRENAAVATGMAIWQYGNRIPLQEGESLKFTSQNELVDALYEYLITLTEGKNEDPSTAGETQIINEEKFVDDLSIVVGSMVRDDERSQDDNTDNDVYQVSLKFSLVVTPDTEKDDLIVKVLDSQGNVVKSARIAGTAADGEDIDFAQRDDNGYYTLDGLKLAENSNAVFNLKLEGIQYLKEGVYIFKSQQLTKEEQVALFGEEVAATEISQNFIGKFSGTTDVDVSMQINMTFNVEESTVTTEHIWRHEQYGPNPENPPAPVPNPADPEPSAPDPAPNNSESSSDSASTARAEVPVPPSRSRTAAIPDPSVPLAGAQETTELNDPDVPLAVLPGDPEIPGAPSELIQVDDPDVPLANVPQTGEMSTAAWLAATLLAGMALIYLNTGKRFPERH